MKRRKNVCFLLFTFALVCLLNACVPAVNLKHEALSKGDMNRGSVVLGTVSDKRAGGYGPEVIGKVRGSYGNPFDVKTDPGRDIEAVLSEVAKTSLEHTGYSTDQAAKKSSRLDIDVLKFWCDGYTGYKIDAEIVVKLINPTDGKILAQKSINAQNGFALFTGYSPMHKAFDEVIDDIQKQLVIFMESEEFQTAAKL